MARMILNVSVNIPSKSMIVLIRNVIGRTVKNVTLLQVHGLAAVAPNFHSIKQ